TPAVPAVPGDPRRPQRAAPVRLPAAPLPRVRPPVRPGPQAGAGHRRAAGVGSPVAPGAAQPAGHRPGRRGVPVLAPGVRQRPVPRADAVGPGAAQKKSGGLVIEADELWSFVGRKRDDWWVWVA